MTLSHRVFVFACCVLVSPVGATAQSLRFTTDASGVTVPAPRAAAAILYDPATGQVLWESAADVERSIASLTKMMTAVVFLESEPDLSQEVTVQRDDTRRAFTTRLRPGYVVSLNDLLHLMLIGSDNVAARVLARTSRYGAEGFVTQMNEKARALGLDNTHYDDPSGLGRDNRSTAYDTVRLLALVSSYPVIASIMQMPGYIARAGTRQLAVRTTNQLVRNGDYDVLAGKTGFLSRAGYCLATLLQLPDSGRQVALVILGAPSSATRFREARGLVAWVDEQARALFGDLRNLD